MVLAITDALDGHIARMQGLVTDFGKLIDPVADKPLIIDTLIALLLVGLCSPWIIVIVLLREFLITLMRMIAAGKGNILSVNNLGKAKTISQIAGLAAI